MIAIFDDYIKINMQYLEKLPKQIDVYEINENDHIRPRIFGGINTKNGEKVIFKFSRPEEIELDNEYKILSNFSNPFIIKPLYFNGFEEFKVLILQRAIGSDLLEHIQQHGPIEEKYVCEMIFSLLNAVNYLHSSGIAHLDIKLENILCLDDSANPQVVLADFGLAAELGERKTLRKYIGTPAFMAPEIHQNKRCFFCRKVEISFS